MLGVYYYLNINNVAKRKTKFGMLRPRFYHGEYYESD